MPAEIRNIYTSSGLDWPERRYHEATPQALTKPVTILLTENGHFNGGVLNAERGCLEEGDAGKSSHCKTGLTELRDEELSPEIVSQHACQTCKADVVFDPALVNAAAARQPAVHAFYPHCRFQRPTILCLRLL